MNDPDDSNETADAPRGVHDMGGLPADPVRASEHEVELWEKRIDALFMLLSNRERRIVRVDELRRSIESLPPDAYDRLSYYERWIASLAALLVEKGILGQDEIDRRVAEIAAREEPLL